MSEKNKSCQNCGVTYNLEDGFSDTHCSYTCAFEHEKNIISRDQWWRVTPGSIIGIGMMILLIYLYST